MLYGQYIVYAESEFFRIFRLILSEVKGKGKLYFLKRMQTHGIISTGLMPAPSEASVHREAYHVDRHGILITNKHIADILRAAAAEDTSALC